MTHELPQTGVQPNSMSELPDQETILQHWGEEEYIKGAVVPPIFQNSLFIFETCDDFLRSQDQASPDLEHYVYSRVNNPTLNVVEKKIAKLEHMDRAKVFGSGMGAISAAILSCVESGSHVVCLDTAYGPTRQLLRDYLPKFGVTTTFVEGSCTEEIIDAIQPETCAIYLESPSSLIFRLQDLRAVCEYARSKSITTIADNSYASPIFQTPADFGVDIVVHSATKYLNGHSDVVSGALATSQERYAQMIDREISLFGAGLAPFPAWLMLRGLRTLAIRMQAHQERGNAIADWLSDQKAVEHVFHVGRGDYPQRELRDTQMSGSSGLLSFEPRSQDEARVRRFCEALRIYRMGVSWGGYESLVVPIKLHPLGWNEEKWIIRLHCGLESTNAMIGDLKNAFEVSEL